MIIETVSYRVLIHFLVKPSARPTFLSGKVGKTIVIRKTCYIFSNYLDLSQKQYFFDTTQVADDVHEYHISGIDFFAIILLLVLQLDRVAPHFVLVRNQKRYLSDSNIQRPQQWMSLNSSSQ